MQKSLTWKIAVAGGAVLGAGFGAVALAGADDPEAPGGVELQASADQRLRNPGSVVSVVPAGVQDPVSAASTRSAGASPAAPSAPSAQSAPSVQSAPSPAAQSAASPASPQSAPSPAPAPAADSPASPASPASAPSAGSVDS